jgi:hypothetical protein
VFYSSFLSEIQIHLPGYPFHPRIHQLYHYTPVFECGFTFGSKQFAGGDIIPERGDQ